MTFETFQKQVGRLRSEWKQAYGKEKEMVFYAALKSISEQSFEAGVTELLLNHRGHAPTCNEIKEAVDFANSKRTMSNKESYFDSVKCFKCDGIGLVGSCDGLTYCDCVHAEVVKKKMNIAPAQPQKKTKRSGRELAAGKDE